MEGCVRARPAEDDSPRPAIPLLIVCAKPGSRLEGALLPGAPAINAGQLSEFTKVARPNFKLLQLPL